MKAHLGVLDIGLGTDMFLHKKLSKFKACEDENLMDNEGFIKKASYFIMVEKLLSEKYIDYQKYIRTIDPSIPKNFIQSIISKIEVSQGKITAIVFKNGIRNDFEY